MGVFRLGADCAECSDIWVSSGWVLIVLSLVTFCQVVLETEEWKIQTDRQTDRQTERQLDRETDRRSDRPSDRHTDRQTDS